MSKSVPSTYCTTNWPTYNAALKQRGSLLIWFDPDMEWLAAPSGRRGRPATFSDAAIQICLMLKALFGLPLRQIEPWERHGSEPHGEAGWRRAFSSWPSLTGLSRTSARSADASGV